MRYVRWWWNRSEQGGTVGHLVLISQVLVWLALMVGPFYLFGHFFPAQADALGQVAFEIVKAIGVIILVGLFILWLAWQPRRHNEFMHGVTQASWNEEIVNRTFDRK